MDNHKPATADIRSVWQERLQMEGAWQRISGKIRAEWGDITDQELEQVRGNWDQLVGTIKQKTGEAAETVENKIRSFMD